MNKVGQVLAAGGLLLTGYLVGFYEFKYKATKAMLEAMLEEEEKEEKAQA